MKRRYLLCGIAAGITLLFKSRPGLAAALPKLEVYRNPGCSCCEGWLQHMQAAGFETAIEDDPDLDGRLASLKIAPELASCHIAIAGKFAFVGHIPATDVMRFLAAPPAGAIGLAVPGMPMGSPGMGSPGSGGSYDVLLVSADAVPAVYATH